MKNDTRPCSRCGETKPAEAYSWNSGYRVSRCNACLAAQATEKRAAKKAAEPPKPKRLTERDLTEKRCNGCAVVKPVTQFYWNIRKWSGRCKTCLSEAARASRAADPEPIRKRARDKNARKSPETLERERAHYRAYYVANRERLLEQKREHWIENGAGILLKKQASKVYKTPEEIRAARVAGQANMAPEVKARKLEAFSQAKRAEWAKLDHTARLERLSNAHTPEARAAVGTALRGRPKSEEHRARQAASLKETQNDPAVRQRMSETTKQQWAGKTREERLAHTAPARAIGLATKSNTSIERAVAAVLDELGIMYEQQVEIFGYNLDFLIRDRMLVIECDGTYWHAMPGRADHDRRRDKCISGCGYRIVRLSDSAIVADAKTAVMSALSDP